MAILIRVTAQSIQLRVFDKVLPFLFSQFAPVEILS
jgi:hypothetical protein